MRKRFFQTFFWFLFLFCFALISFAYEIEVSLLKEFFEESSSFPIVFGSLNYQTENDFLSDINSLAQRLKTTKPFSDSDYFQFWHVRFLEKDINDIFETSFDFPPLEICPLFLSSIFNEIKQPYKLVIIDAKGSVSCAQLSDIQKTSIIVLGKKRYLSEESFAKGFLHELGHALGLREESTGYQKFPLPGYPNCATTREDAVSWWGDLAEQDDRVTYFAGCAGNKDYLRPTAISLMNDPDKAEEFGPVNERYLRQQLERNF